MCLRSAILKRCLRKVTELDYFSKKLRRSWKIRSGPSSGSAIDLGSEDRVVLLEQSLQVQLIIYKQPFTFQSTVLIDLAVLV